MAEKAGGHQRCTFCKGTGKQQPSGWKCSVCGGSGKMPIPDEPPAQAPPDETAASDAPKGEE
jgi:hypothetical protein